MSSLLGLAVLAGCTGGGDESSEEGAGGDDPPVSKPVGVGTSTLHVVVLDMADFPILDVTVGIREIADSVLATGEDGSVEYQGLEAGTYTVEVVKIGFGSEAQAATVDADAFVEVVFQLEPVKVISSYSKLDILLGELTCGSGTYFLTQVACGEPYPGVEPFGPQDFRHLYNITPEMSGVLWEIDWESTQVLSKDLTFLLEQDGCGLTCPDSSTFGTVEGCCTLRLALDASQLDIPDVSAHTNGATIQSRTFPAFESSDGLPTVYTNQKFTIYVEYFWGALPADFAEGRTNVPDL